MKYIVQIDKIKIIDNLKGLLPSLTCFGKIISDTKEILEWHIDESVIEIQCALEYLKRIIPEHAILECKKYVRPKFIKPQKNTRKKQGSQTRVKRK